uniref:Sulfotransferase n=1 Tax=Oryza sativa subsp. japonica TaxID=39947 RepID=Q94LH5_ORYSJ|nr:Unknown protein [Oryza sativa Japonica Group]
MGGSKAEEKPAGGGGGGEDWWCYQFGNKKKGIFDSLACDPLLIKEYDVGQDALIVKSSKKSPLALRMVVFAMTMICGIFICTMCMKQLGSDSLSRIVKIEVAEQLCNKSAILHSEVHFVHYPQPITYSRSECKCTPVRFFAIISSQRSGSGWFETLLNSHMNVSSNGEIFSSKERRSNISSITKTLDKVYNLDWNSSASKNECTAAVGLKWMLNQGLVANHADIADYFNRRGVSAIFLFRWNLLRQLVSQLANNHDRYLKQLNGTHKAHVHTAYEKLLDVLDFLKVPRSKLVSRHVKIHTKPLSEQIENWDEVYNALNGTQYESFLNADYRI